LEAPIINPKSTIKTLDRIKLSSLAERLIHDIGRVMPPDAALFHDAVVRTGAPETTQAMRYLPFNRQVHVDGDVTSTLSLVVLFNNLCMERFFLKGVRERLSRLAFTFSFNVMDRFIRSVRLDQRLLHIMSTSAGEFSMMGIVQRDEVNRKRFSKRHYRVLYPLMLIPITDAVDRNYLVEFEKRQAIGSVKIPLLPLYRKGPAPALNEHAKSCGTK
jgi:hypothetical protein